MNKVGLILASLFILNACSTSSIPTVEKEEKALEEIKDAKFLAKEEEEEKGEAAKDQETPANDENETEKEQAVEEVTKELEETPNLAEFKEEFLHKAKELEASIQTKWEQSEATGTGEIAGLIYEDYEAWEALMQEILATLEKHMKEADHGTLAKEQTRWAEERDAASEKLANAYDELGLMAQNDAYDLLLNETKERSYELIDTYFK